NGLEATRRILKARPRTEVLILTIHESDQVVREVVEAGAHGYVLKSDAGRDLVDAVRALAEHRPFFLHRVAESVSPGAGAGTAGGGEGKPRARLTTRER